MHGNKLIVQKDQIDLLKPKPGLPGQQFVLQPVNVTFSPNTYYPSLYLQHVFLERSSQYGHS